MLRCQVWFLLYTLSTRHSCHFTRDHCRRSFYFGEILREAAAAAAPFPQPVPPLPTFQQRNTRENLFLLSPLKRTAAAAAVWRWWWWKTKENLVQIMIKRGMFVGEDGVIISCLILYSSCPPVSVGRTVTIPSTGILLYSFVTYMLIIGSMELILLMIIIYDLFLSRSVVFVQLPCVPSFKRSNRIFKQLIYLSFSHVDVPINTKIYKSRSEPFDLSL